MPRYILVYVFINIMRTYRIVIAHESTHYHRLALSRNTVHCIDRSTQSLAEWAESLALLQSDVK